MRAGTGALLLGAWLASTPAAARTCYLRSRPAPACDGLILTEVTPSVAVAWDGEVSVVALVEGGYLRALGERHAVGGRVGLSFGTDVGAGVVVAASGRRWLGRRLALDGSIGVLLPFATPMAYDASPGVHLEVSLGNDLVAASLGLEAARVSRVDATADPPDSVVAFAGLRFGSYTPLVALPAAILLLALVGPDSQ